MTTTITAGRSMLLGGPLKAPRRQRRLVTAVALLLFACVALHPSIASAWIFTEHARISQRGIRGATLRSPGAADVLRAVETELGVCPAETTRRDCPTLAALPALAGDHSCSPSDLRSILTEWRADQGGHWLGNMLEVTADIDRDLAVAGQDAEERDRIRRQLNMDLQTADRDYLARALVDYSHFQLAREGHERNLAEYVKFSSAAGTEANATASYVNYHMVALRLALDSVGATNRNELLVKMFVAEAFALHFLEDSFSAGHVVGHWGSTALRLGTHDHYSRSGVETTHWSSATQPVVVHGDSYMSTMDEAYAARAVSESLAQVLGAATGTIPRSALPPSWSAFGVDEYDTCRERNVPLGLEGFCTAPTFLDVLRYEPVPTPHTPALPRFQAEQGFFFGVAGRFGLGYQSRGDAWTPQLGATLRVGYGAAAIVDDALNGQGFVDFGAAAEYRSRGGAESLSLTGWSVHARAPGYLTLVDGGILLFLAGTLQGDCPGCLRAATAAGRGGLFRIWKSHRFPIGNGQWQISALREGTLNVFTNERDGLLSASRFEIFAPVLTARWVVPISGDSLSQSTDAYLSIGPVASLANPLAFTSGGVLATFTVSARLFP